MTQGLSPGRRECGSEWVPRDFPPADTCAPRQRLPDRLRPTQRLRFADLACRCWYMVYGKQPERCGRRKGGTTVFSILHAIVATVLILGPLGLSSFAVRSRWQHKFVSDPLKIIADASGRASLSSAQVFFFTLIVALAGNLLGRTGRETHLYRQFRTRIVGHRDCRVLCGQDHGFTRFRATGENWAWARKKNWIKKDFTKASVERTPKIGDLLSSDQGFDIARFRRWGFRCCGDRASLQGRYSGGFGRIFEVHHRRSVSRSHWN